MSDIIKVKIKCFIKMWHKLDSYFCILRCKTKKKPAGWDIPNQVFATLPQWRSTFAALFHCKNQRQARIQHREPRALSSVCHDITWYGWNKPLSSTKLALPFQPLAAEVLSRATSASIIAARWKLTKTSSADVWSFLDTFGITRK